MPLVRGVRLFNAIESGDVNSSQLQTLLSSDAGRYSEFQGMLSNHNLCRRLAASDLSTTTIAGSNLATEALLTSPDGNNALANNPTYVKKFTTSDAFGPELFKTIVEQSTFTAATLPANVNWSKLAYGGNGVFVAVAGYNNSTTQAARSTDFGKTWTSTTMPSSQNWSSVAYGNGRFVAIAGKGTNSTTNAAAYSTDGGATWIAATMPSNQTWSEVIYDPTFNRFVAIAGGGTNSNATAFSTNGGQTWTAGGNLSQSTKWSSITYDSVSKRLIAVPGWGGSEIATNSWSNDGGTTWQGGSLLANAWSAVTSSNGKTIVFGGSNVPLQATRFSTDGGSNWNTGPTPPSGSQRWGAESYGDVFVTTLATNPNYMVSTDGGNSFINSPLGPNLFWADVKRGAGVLVFIAGGTSQSDVVYTSAP
jgi:hypothetical protein